MLDAILLGAGVALLVIAAAALPARLLIHELRIALDRERMVRDEALSRIRELEVQVASMHRQGLTVTSEPIEEIVTPPPAPLPKEAAAWLAGFEDPDAREEMRAHVVARLQAQPDRPVHEIIAELL